MSCYFLHMEMEEGTGKNSPVILSCFTILYVIDLQSMQLTTDRLYNYDHDWYVWLPGRYCSASGSTRVAQLSIQQFAH